MGNSNLASARRKVASGARPDWRKTMGLHPDFPLFPQGNKDQPNRLRWAKKVRGKLHYFGKVADDAKGAAALDEWLRVKDELLAGRKPRSKSEQGLTIAELCDRFVVSKDRRLESGEITQRTRDEAKEICDRLVEQFGKSRLVSDVGADDFDSLRQRLAKRLGPVALGNAVQRVRSVFKYGFESGLLAVPMRYGAEFKRPAAKVVRLARAAKGSRMVEPAELRQLIDSADVHMRAMIYLALNAGYGNADCGSVTRAAVNLHSGWINFPRPKTGIPRRCPLWKETVDAIKASAERRPKPKTPDAEATLFVTKYGASWAKNAIDNPVSKAFRKLLNKLELHRPGISFYSLRHVHRTIADRAKDQPAANLIMGHADPTMGAVYREHIDDERLVAVVDHIRRWLFAQPQTSSKLRIVDAG